MFKQLKQRVTSLLKFPMYEVAEIRRQWMANVLHIIFAVLAFISFLDSVWTFWPVFGDAYGTLYTFLTLGSFLGLVFAIWLNTYTNLAPQARFFMLVILSVVMAASDDPVQVIQGRSMILFAIPIMISSFILTPVASFGVALLLTIGLSIFGTYAMPGVEIFPIYQLISFLAIAAVSWLAAWSMESVLNNLHDLVAERTDRLDKTVKRLIRASRVITEYSQDLAKTSEHLEKANNFKNLFLGSFREELRTQLESILANSSMGSEDISTGALRSPELARIYRSGRLLKALVMYIVDLGDLESGRIELNKNAVNLDYLLRSTTLLMEEQAKKRNLRLVLNLVSEPMFVMADKNRLEQVMVNLLSQACRFSPESSDVVIELNKLIDGQAQICIRDASVGLQEQTAATIFEPFRRMGVSRRLVELHDGKIELQTDPQQGTSFIITLPLLSNVAL